MPIFVYVQSKGAAAPAKIDADSFEKIEGTTTVLLKKSGKIVGEFYLDETAAYWVAEEPDTKPRVH